MPKPSRHFRRSLGKVMKALRELHSPHSVRLRPTTPRPILEVLLDASAEGKVAAARAALLAAQRMEKAGNKDGASKLRAAVASAEVPDYIKSAAK